MKTINETTTGSLFNHTGILNHAGDFAGKYQEQAFDIFAKYGIARETLSDNEWLDIMHDNKGKCYAIYAEDSLTCQNAFCAYIEIDESDCEQAYNEAQTHLD